MSLSNARGRVAATYRLCARELPIGTGIAKFSMIALAVQLSAFGVGVGIARAVTPDASADLRNRALAGQVCNDSSSDAKPEWYDMACRPDDKLNGIAASPAYTDKALKLAN